MPEKLNIASHGSTGVLLRSLQRYGQLGWILFGVTLVLLVAVALAALLLRPVVVTNESGQIIGKIEYFDELTRTDSELVASSMYFIRHNESVNAGTIWHDKAVALSMMSKELEAKQVRIQQETNFYDRIVKANNVSRIEFIDDGQYGNKVIRREGHESEIMVNGVIIIGKTKPIRHPFRKILTLKAIPRTHAGKQNMDNVEGVEVTHIEDI